MNNEQFFYYLCQKFNFTYGKFKDCNILIVTQPFVVNNNFSILFYNFDTDLVCIANKISIESDDNIIVYEGCLSISPNQATLCYNQLKILLNQYNEATFTIKSNILKSKLEVINKDF